MPRKVFYAHSGGVTATINSTAVSFIKSALASGIDEVYIGINGLKGLITKNLFPAHTLTTAQLNTIANSPGSAFGSCRKKLPSSIDDNSLYQTITRRLKEFDCEAFCYNGGNDSQDTCNKLYQYFESHNHPIQVIGIPKTIDNDLVGNHCCPGFGSAARYINTSILDAAMDIRAMAHTSTQVFILEVMGRDSGWLAASCILATSVYPDLPLVIVTPEATPSREQLLEIITNKKNNYGYCIVCIAEGSKIKSGLSGSTQIKDDFGHMQYSGSSLWLKDLLQKNGIKSHCGIASILQRSARHLISSTDQDISIGVGNAATQALNSGQTGIMITVNYNEQSKKWYYNNIACGLVANKIRKVPDHFIDANTLSITNEALIYFKQCLNHNGSLELPQYAYQSPIHSFMEQPI